MVTKVTTPEQERLIIELYENGWSRKKVGDKLGMSQTPIDRVLRENNIKAPPWGSWSIGVPKTTSWAQEENIVRLYKAGLSKKSIENEIGIGREVVARVLRDWGVKVRSSGGFRPYNVRSNCFDNLRDEYAVYWLGFLFADGTVNRSNIDISLAKKDKDHLRKLELFFGCGERIRPISVGKYEVVKLAISDTVLANKMRELCIEPHRPRGVEILQMLPKESLSHFLRGWFDGDGSAYRFPQLCFAGRPPFLMEVQKVFIENAHANPVTLKWNGNPNKIIRVLVYRGVNRCGEIAKYLYKDATIWLARKRDRILAWPVSKKKDKRFWG